MFKAKEKKAYFSHKDNAHELCERLVVIERLSKRSRTNLANVIVSQAVSWIERVVKMKAATHRKATRVKVK